MIDLGKLKALKMLGYVLLVIVACVVGVGIGQSLSGTKAKETKQETKQVSDDVLKEEDIEDFLIAYFTKKDLGENRKRYKEYMTDAMYQQEVAREDEPITQTYKGFVVDFKYKSSEIYINEDKLQVLTQVNYVNTLLDEKKNYDTAQKDVMNKLTLRLTYVKDKDGKLKVNKMESIILTDQTGSYGILDNTTTKDSSEEETSSNGSSASSSDDTTESSTKPSA